MQKLLFGLLMASRKLRHYFQAHEITVVTRLPLQRILHNPDAIGRIVEWALELSSFGLNFESTSTIQSRVLAEFVAEWTATPDEETQETTLLGKEQVVIGSCTLMELSPYRASGWRTTCRAHQRAPQVRDPDALPQGGVNKQYG